ncbi:MAG: ATP-binding cassette domain-containing protein, partial [Acidaminococcaceae bacterium]
KGKDITAATVHERAKLGVGVMIQRPPTIRGLSLRQMVEICGATKEETETMAAWMGLDRFLDRSVNEGFSGGEIKRSELLQLMAQNPDLLLLDEPESGVDVENIALVGRAANYILTKDFGSCSKECNKSCCTHNPAACSARNPLQESNKAGLIITHLGHILKYVPSDMAHILYQGTLSCSGDPQEMLACIGKTGYEHCIKTGCRRGL